MLGRILPGVWRLAQLPTSKVELEHPVDPEPWQVAVVASHVGSKSPVSDLMFTFWNVCFGANERMAWYIRKGLLALSAIAAASYIFCSLTLRALLDACFICCLALLRCKM